MSHRHTSSNAQQNSRHQDEVKITVEYHRPSREAIQDYSDLIADTFPQANSYSYKDPYSSSLPSLTPSRSAPPPPVRSKTSVDPSSPRARNSRQKLPPRGKKLGLSNPPSSVDPFAATPIKQSFPSNMNPNQTSPPPRPSRANPNTLNDIFPANPQIATRPSAKLKKGGMLGGIFDFLTSSKRPEISTAYDPVHLTHVGFNSSMGEFTGLPKEWQQLLQESDISIIKQEENPQTVMEVVKFYQEGRDDIWDNMGAVGLEQRPSGANDGFGAPRLAPPPPKKLTTPGRDRGRDRDPTHPLPLQHSHSSIPPEAMLQDLTEYITKDEEFPTSRGGFGEVWKCTYKTDQRQSKVAVKALMMYSSDQFGEAKEKKIKRIWHELRICARLQHKNILPICGYTFGFGPLIAIVNPWAENGNLTAYFERSGAALTLVRRFQILRDITHGLQYLHTNNVIHGDFNGPNVLIYGDGTACLADFGLSLMHSELVSASQASWTSTFKGNLRWMAPELLGEREDGSPVRPSRQSDVFSFGGIMLQVLTNKIPYYHLTNDAAIILCIHKLQKPPRTRYPVISDKYWHFMVECWSGEPQKRPSTERLVDMVGDELDLLSS